ncbi:LysM peptidoglycan-binding domain-containing protein [Flavobacterium sp.]|uniref:LysM peptidoglycan-binding domain-containing protein n=1 Tax=Flavobacterium sp. TaxID=239 RepID=UPI00286E4CF2|nr:LysM peptidoglycan-binding domain-containing protein [Flavobacterium sp.]
MRFLHKFVIVVLFFPCFLYSQNTVQHKVEKGETIFQIAKKYNVSTAEIFKLNPNAQNGIQENVLLLIPDKSGRGILKKVEIKTATYTVNHRVLPKETLYGISKLYNITAEDIEKENKEILKEGLKIDMVLIIKTKTPVKKQEESKQIASKKPIFHIVKPKETKYSIAKQYDTTVEKLEKLNPEIISGLPDGYNLLISGERPKVIELKPEISIEAPKISEVLHLIEAKETLFSISTKYQVTQEELIALNPELKDNIKEGTTIKIPLKSSATTQKKPYNDLSKTIKLNGTKKLALLLPFNIAKLDQDTINSTKSRLKKDKFLNMTLDFYAGALIAIDSVKKMGLNVDITILDSDETKSTSDISRLISQYRLKSMDAIIGPFYQNNAEKTAELLNSSNVPVISPLSKDYDKSFSNLIQATPTSEFVKNEMFEFMRSKNGNIIAVVDPKKIAAKQYLLENHKDIVFAEFNEKGILNVEQLKSLLSKDKLNFVLMETERTNLILSTTSALLNALKEYQIRLVILSENEALDYDEIAMSRLTKLKMHYPSLVRDNDSEEAKIFESTFKKKNKILPNAFATRGFDVTFDVLMRLNQEKSFLETLDETASEQVENKFYYTPNANGGYTNNGVYVLYYDTDLTIKEAK